MTRANLHGAIFTGVSLASVTLTGVRSGGITHGPARMPRGYVIRTGYLLRVLATPVFSLASGPQSVALHHFGRSPGAVTYAAQVCDAPGLNCLPAIRVTTAGHTFTGLSAQAIYTVKLTALGNGTTAANSRTASHRAVAGAAVAHVVWVLMENEDYARVIGSASAPYINSLARTYGLATNYAAVSHPSLPNYIALTSGSTRGITDDGNPPSHRLAVNSIFSQMNGNWKALEESMPSNCSSRDSGLYAVRHNPVMYFTSLAAQCATNDIPLGATPDISSAFTLVTPNLCSDMHDCGIAAGNKWLSTFIPKLLASPQYRAGSTVIFVVWDENSSGAAGNRVPAVVVSPWTKSTRSSAAFTHYSVLRTTEELLGVPLIGGAQQAPSMRSTFNLS
jgi:hypothetical protein